MASIGGDVQAGQWGQGQRLKSEAIDVIALTFKDYESREKRYKNVNELCTTQLQLVGQSIATGRL
jgi:hypothetical protein